MKQDNATVHDKATKRTRTRNFKQIVQHALENGTIEAWATAGATDKEIAYYLGIGKDSFIKAKKTIPELVDKIQHARSPLVPEAFNSLVKLARGFTYEEKVEEVKEVIVAGNIVRLHSWTTYTKYQPPTVNAIARVIVNYQKQQRDGVQGVPDFYITEQPQDTTNKNGRLEELDKALYQLFFGKEPEGNEGKEEQE